MDGFALQNLREEQGLSREELAEKILVTESIIQSWEEGWSFISPSSWEIEAMADAFNMTEDELRTAIDHDECEDSDNQNDSSDNILSNLVANVVSTAAVIVTDAVIDSAVQRRQEKKQKKEEERLRLEAIERARREKAENRRKKRIRFYKRHWKALFVLVAIICIGLFVGYKYYEYQSSILVALSSESAVGKEYSSVKAAFERAGFKNVYVEPEYDIDIDEIKLDGSVKEISISGNSDFKKSDKFPSYATVEIIYHAIKDIPVPVSAKEAKKLNYVELENMLFDSGYINVEAVAEHDLVTGWLTKDGKVKSITINGNSSFGEGASFRPDAEVVIIYHTFKNR